MIPANQREYQKAFSQHLLAIQSIEKAKEAEKREAKKREFSASCNLLLFYAVECGLKALHIRMKEKKTETKEIGHNLPLLVRELKINPKTIPNIQLRFRLPNNKKRWDVDEIHQAWRYGVEIDPTDEQTIVDWLKDLCKWIKNRINERGLL